MNQYQDTKIIDCVAPTGGVTVGVPVKIGSFVVIPSATVAGGKTFAGQLDGAFPIRKATGFAPAVGDIAYFDLVTDKRLEATGFPIGRYVEAAGSSATRAIVLLMSELVAAALAVQRIEFMLHPPSAVAASRDYIWTAPDDGEFIDGDHELYTEGRPSSSSGTVVETVLNLNGDVNILSASNVELKAGIVNGTALQPALSATAANRRFVRGDKIQWRITTSNADAVANSGIAHNIGWRRYFAA